MIFHKMPESYTHRQLKFHSKGLVFILLSFLCLSVVRSYRILSGIDRLVSVPPSALVFAHILSLFDAARWSTALSRYSAGVTCLREVWTSNSNEFYFDATNVQRRRRQSLPKGLLQLISYGLLRPAALCWVWRSEQLPPSIWGTDSNSASNKLPPDGKSWRLIELRNTSTECCRVFTCASLEHRLYKFLTEIRTCQCNQEIWVNSTILR